MSEHILKDGRTLILRDPTLADAQEMIDYLKIVGGETDFLLADENGIEGLTLEGEQGWITSTLESPNTKMFVGTIDGEIVLVCDVRAAGRPRIAHVGGIAISIKRAYWHLGIGNIAMRLGRKLAWDPAAERFADDEANTMLGREMRGEWSLDA